MHYDPERHHRRTVRLPAYDYAGPGLYFVTICAHERAALFGGVAEDTMRLSPFGWIAEEEWQRTPHVRADVALDHHVVMPNHVHLLFAITVDHADPSLSSTPGPSDTVGATRCVALDGARGDIRRNAKGPIAQSVGAIIGQYKSAVSRRINAVRETPGASVWQRGYHEHIVRNERQANRIRHYILENPAQWQRDRYHQG
jgi:putative transposase